MDDTETEVENTVESEQRPKILEKAKNFETGQNFVKAIHYYAKGGDLASAQRLSDKHYQGELVPEFKPYSQKKHGLIIASVVILTITQAMMAWNMPPDAIPRTDPLTLSSHRECVDGTGYGPSVTIPLGETVQLDLDTEMEAERGGCSYQRLSLFSEVASSLEGLGDGLSPYEITILTAEGECGGAGPGDGDCDVTAEWSSEDCGGTYVFELIGYDNDGCLRGIESSDSIQVSFKSTKSAWWPTVWILFSVLSCASLLYLCLVFRQSHITLTKGFGVVTLYSMLITGIRIHRFETIQNGHYSDLFFNNLFSLPILPFYPLMGEVYLIVPILDTEITGVLIPMFLYFTSLLAFLVMVVSFIRPQRRQRMARIAELQGKWDKASALYERMKDWEKAGEMRQKGVESRSGELVSLDRIAEVLTPEMLSLGREVEDDGGSEEAEEEVSEPELQPVRIESSSEEELRERFSVGDRIAKGGMATVFLATDKESEDTVIWKQAHGEHNPLKVSNLKLSDEIELLQIINHPRVPRLIAHAMVSGQGKTETRVLVEEYVEGGDLSMMVKQFSKVGIQLPFEKVREYLDGVCDVLAHMAGLPDPVYHRDLKPHNIIIHPQHGPVLIDFGLAKMVATGEDVSVTRGGSGTWTAPERDSGISGPFTDVYSLGKILYYLLTNESPAAILSEEKVQIITEAEHPKWLADLTLKAAWPEREKRIQTAQQFRILLNNEGKWPQDQEVMGADTGADEYTTWR